MKSINLKIKLAVILFLISIVNVLPQNVVVVVIDGARYSESFGAKDKYMPNIWNKLLKEGTLYTNYYNEGRTLTNPGHSSIASGNWEYVKNNGCEEPQHPTMFEYFRKQKNIPKEKVWVIAGADKLESIAYSESEEFGEDYGASVETNDYTGDQDTYENLMEVFQEEKPILTLVNFKQVDSKGHDDEWEEYLEAIQQVDNLIYTFWNYLQNDPFYKGNTTMLITNDHGRHDDKHGGFESHGCGCEGCKHIMLFAIGPDFEKGAVVNERKTQLNIAPTVAEILGFEMATADSTSLLLK